MRALRIIGGVAGLIVCAFLIYVHVARYAQLRDEPVAMAAATPGFVVWVLAYGIGVAISVGAIVLSPKEFKESWKEPEVPRAAWLDQKKD